MNVGFLHENTTLMASWMLFMGCFADKLKNDSYSQQSITYQESSRSATKTDAVYVWWTQPRFVLLLDVKNRIKLCLNLKCTVCYCKYWLLATIMKFIFNFTAGRFVSLKSNTGTNMQRHGTRIVKKIQWQWSCSRRGQSVELGGTSQLTLAYHSLYM